MNKPLIYSLLLTILMVIAPHAEHLPLWISALCVALLLWRAYLTRSGSALPRRWLLMLITLASAGGVFISFHTLLGREAGVAMLILLSALKLMELRTARDTMVLIYLSCFILITHFFYSQSIFTALYLFAALMVVMTTWIKLHAPDITLHPRLRIASVLLLQAIPLTLILFVLFPRIPGPLWGLPQDAFSRSGLDDKMSPGSMSRLILSDEVAFRVSFTGKPPRREQLYWRGPVLWDFDGQTWTPGKAARIATPQLTGLAEPVDYTVTLEPHNKNWLFMLDMPASISIPASLTHDFQVLSKESVTARLRYDARSNLAYQANLQETGPQIQRALLLPLRDGGAKPSGAGGAARQLLPQTADSVSNVSQLPPSNPRTRQLASEWRANGENDATVVRTALDYFHRQNFAYTLEPLPLGINSVDDFLFETRQGFCEHYASAFVFLMRAAHIPARVVTGYQGGEFNSIGNYHIVRQSDAHAWAEVWLSEQGWVRIDPTAAIAPARVQSGLSAALPDNAALPFMARNPPQWAYRLRLNWDMITNQWNQWVLGYDTERQFAFLTRLGMESISWQKMAVNMVTGAGLLIALFALFMLRHLLPQRPDKVQNAWLKLCRKLAKAGLPRAAHEGAQCYAQRIAAARPDLADAILDLATRYNALRYGKKQDENARHLFVQQAAILKI